MAGDDCCCSNRKEEEEEEKEKMNNSKKKKMKVVVVMGATGAGKSRLAIDLASTSPQFKFEIINADSMQVYRGLDVLTNKVPFHERKGVPHHLLGTIDPNVEFTSKQFRNLAIPIIEDIVGRGGVPLIVGGTNYYIQALVSPFLTDDVDDYLPNDIKDILPSVKRDENSPSSTSNNFATDYDLLKELDIIAANRIHPNDHRKAKHYLNLYATSGILPSELLQGKNSQTWGNPENFRYDCCFIWVDASLPVIDRYVDGRVDCMIKGGLLNEVCDIYNPTADYTRGIRQAIGVREFEAFFSNHLFNKEKVEENNINHNVPIADIKVVTQGNLKHSLVLNDTKQKKPLEEAIHTLKTNTRRLLRRQKRRLNRLQSLFGWNLNYFDATEALEGSSEDHWQQEVIEPCISLVKAFLCNNSSVISSRHDISCESILGSRDLWTQYVCEACGNRILRGAHEWEQHQLGRGHRKRISAMRRKSLCCRSVEPQPAQLDGGYPSDW